MGKGWLRAPRALWLAALLSIGSAAGAAAAGATTPEARFEAALAAWRTAAEPDAAALFEAFVALPDFVERMDGVAAALVASMPETETEAEAVGPGAMAAVEEGLVQVPVSLSLHARAMALAADLDRPDRAAEAERAVTALATACAASGDGTARRPWRVLDSTDALTFAALRGGETIGRRFVRNGDGTALLLYVAEDHDGDGDDVRVAEHVFSLAAVERLETTMRSQGVPAFARYAALLGALMQAKDISGASSFVAMSFAMGAEDHAVTARFLAQLPENEEIDEDLFARAMLASYRVRRKDATPMPITATAPLDELIALAERGLPPAIRELAVLIERGRLPGMAPAEATALMRTGAERGSASLAAGFANGLYQEGNRAEAQAWMRRAIDLGSLGAVGQLGWWRLAEGALDEPLAGQVRDAAARGDALSMVVEGLRALRAGSAGERERGRSLLLGALRNADHAEVGNDVAYELALGTSRAPKDAALAVEIMVLNFSIHAYARGKPAHVDTHAVALAAAGRQQEALEMIANALKDTDGALDPGGFVRGMLERHMARIRTGQEISEATDEEDRAALEANRRAQP